MEDDAKSEVRASARHDVFSNLARRALHSPTLMSWLATAARIGGNGVLIFLITIKFDPAGIAVLFFLLTISNIYWMADLGLSPLFARLFAYGFGGASIDQLLHDLKYPEESGRGLGEADWHTIRTIFDMQQIFFGFIALLTLFAGGLVGTWLLLPQISRLAVPSAGWISWCVVLASSTLVLGGKTYANFLLGSDRIATQKRYESIVNAIAAFAGIVSVLISPDLVLVSIIYFGFPTISVLINRVIAFRVYHGRLACEGRVPFQRDIAVALWPQAWRMSVGILCGQIVLNFSSLIITRSADSLMAAQLLFSLRLVRIFDTFSATPTTVMLPTMARLYYQGLSKGFEKLVYRSVLFSLPIMAVPGLLIAFVGQPALQQIGSKIGLLPPPIWLLLVLGGTLMRYGAIHLQVVTVRNKVLWHIANGIAGLVFLTSLYVAMLFMEVGIAYVLAYFLGAILFYAPYSVVQSYRLLDDTTRYRDMFVAGTILGALTVVMLFMMMGGLV